jgi:hypothetical protein
MGTRISAEEARRLVLESSDLDLVSLADALNQSAPEFSVGVSVRLVADMLQVGEPENWERTTRAFEKSEELFRPYLTIPKEDGTTYCSWLPEVLADGDEHNIRAFAETTRNDFVRARVFEILWSRFGNVRDAYAAIDARFASAKQCDAEKDWPRLVKNLGRLTTLTLKLNHKKCLGDLAVVLDEAAEHLVRSSYPFSFPVLADMVCNTILKKRRLRDMFTVERGKRWGGLLGNVAHRLESDPHHGHDALMVLQAWHGRWGDELAMKVIQRRIVEQLRDIGRKADPMLAPSLHDQALRAALDFGIPDLAEAMRGDLMASIQSSVPAFKQTSGTFTLPPELLADIDNILASASLPGAIRQLSLFPGMLEVDAAALRATAKEQLKELVFLQVIPSVHYHPDGKITFRSNDPDGNVEKHAAFLVGAHLAFVEALLRYVLAQALGRFEPRTLIDALAAWPHLPTHRARLLAVAAERFAKADWISSGFIVIPIYEAVLRDLLRAGGYPALKSEPGGVQMDETLNSLIRCASARSVLGDGYCDLVEYVLCDPALGWNLRNEIAHGTIHARALTPMRVFLAWLLLVRLTCLTALPNAAKEGAEPRAAADARPMRQPADGSE